MEPARDMHEMGDTNLDFRNVLVEKLCESEAAELVAQKGGKKPEVPPKPIVPQNNFKYRDKMLTRVLKVDCHEVCKSTDETNKQLLEGTLNPPIKLISIHKDTQKINKLELVMYEGKENFHLSAGALLKPPLLPKPSSHVHQINLVSFPHAKNKLSSNIGTPIHVDTDNADNIGVDFDISNIKLVHNAANLLETDTNAVIVEKCYNVSLDHDCYKHCISDHDVAKMCSLNEKTVADCDTCETTNSFSRYEPFSALFNKNTNIHRIISFSLPNLCFEAGSLVINSSSKVMLKNYPCANAVCDTFYPSDTQSLCMKFVGFAPGVMTDSSCIASRFVRDSIKDDLSVFNTELPKTLRDNNFVLPSNVKHLEMPFVNMTQLRRGNSLDCNLKSKFTSSVCSSCKSHSENSSYSFFTNLPSVDTKIVTPNVQNIYEKPFSRRYSLPPSYGSYLKGKFQPQPLNNKHSYDIKNIHKVSRTSQSCKSTGCFEYVSGNRNSKCKDSKFSFLLEKIKSVRELKSNSKFYFKDHLSERKEMISASEEALSESLSEQEEKSHTCHPSKAVDLNRPASGLSDTLEFDEKSDTRCSQTIFNVQDISDSDNDESTPSLLQPISLTDIERKEKKAFFTVKELVTSEKVFVGVLRLLTEDFKNTVQVSEKMNGSVIIPAENFSKILNNLPQLQHLNEDLLHDLENRINNWDTVKKVSDVIVKKGPFLKLYSTYIQNFEFQCNYLDDCCCKYPKFARIVKEFEASPLCKKLSLKHYMIKPVQRIPQYRLILSDYLSNQDYSSLDYEDTKTALKIVCDVADHANRGLKLGDGLKKLMQLQSKLRNYEIIKPGRDLIKDGELFKLSRKVMQPRYFILLNDCLLCTSYVGSTIHSAESIKVNYHLPLNDLKVSVPKTQAYENEFNIISTQRSFSLSARSSEERDEWVSVLKETIREYERRKESFKRKQCDTFLSCDKVSLPAFNLGKDAPVWVHDFRVTRCQSCTGLFTVTFRRHHCRACGKVVCGNCSENRAPLEYKKYQSARVCSDCFERLLKGFEESPPQLGCDKLDTIRARFVKKGEAGKKKYVPERLLEVCASDTKSQMSGWLQKRSRRSWKRYWFVLKNQVLYVYKASEDVVALESIPVLGYKVVSLKETPTSLYEGVDKNLVFQLLHIGQTPITFHADSEHMTAKWITALEAETVI